MQPIKLPEARGVSPYLYPGLRIRISGLETLHTIRMVVMREMDITEEELTSEAGDIRIKDARHLLLYMARVCFPQWPLRTIGERVFGTPIQHSTVIYGLKKMEVMIRHDDKISGHYAQIMNALELEQLIVKRTSKK